MPLKNTINTVGLIVFSGNRVLLIQHKRAAHHVSGTYGLPAGKIEPGETGIDAVVREFNEETGLTTRAEYIRSFPDNKYSASIPDNHGNINTYSYTVFICSHFEGELHPSDETKPVWIPINKLSNYTLLPNVQKAIFKAMQYNSIK